MGSDDDREFFVVARGGVNTSYDTQYLKAEGSVFGDAPRCEECGTFVGLRAWLPPFRAELIAHGKSWGDFVFFSASDFLVSSRVKTAFETSRMTGLEDFARIEVVSYEGLLDAPHEYYRVVVTRSLAAVDEERSQVVRAERYSCPRCRSAEVDAINGFVLESESLPSEDIFFARGLPGIVIASDRFRRTCLENGFTNVRFTPTGAYAWDPLGASRAR